MRNWIILPFVLLLSASCDGHKDVINDMSGTSWGPGAFNSNGERIYFTATSERDTPIRASNFSVDNMAMMMQGIIACASCHGPQAHGGVHRMGMHTMNAPDIRWKMLSSEHHHEGDDSDADEHAEETFTFDDFKNAVEGGRHPDGDPLSTEMPRWRMSDEDFHDLASYLQSLP